MWRAWYFVTKNWQQMWNVLWQQIDRALFDTIFMNEISWLNNLKQLVVLHSSNLNTYRHNFFFTTIISAIA